MTVFLEIRYSFLKNLKIALGIKRVTRIGFTFFYRNIQRWSRGHKARGQGQVHKKNPRPRTEPLEAKDRNVRGQGQKCSRPRPRTKDTGASVLQKKKGLQKFFSGDLEFVGVARIFDWGGLNHKSHEMTSSKFFHRESTCGTKLS